MQQKTIFHNYEVHYHSVYGTYEIYSCKAKNKEKAKFIAQECVGMDYEETIKIIKIDE